MCSCWVGGGGLGDQDLKNPDFKNNNNTLAFSPYPVQVILVPSCCLFCVLSNDMLNVCLYGHFLEDACTSIKDTQNLQTSTVTHDQPCIDNKTPKLESAFPKPLAVICVNLIHEVLCCKIIGHSIWVHLKTTHFGMCDHIWLPITFQVGGICYKSMVSY